MQKDRVQYSELIQVLRWAELTLATKIEINSSHSIMMNLSVLRVQLTVFPE